MNKENIFKKLNRINNESIKKIEKIKKNEDKLLTRLQEKRIKENDNLLKKVERLPSFKVK